MKNEPHFSWNCSRGPRASTPAHSSSSSPFLFLVIASRNVPHRLAAAFRGSEQAQVTAGVLQ